MHAFDAEDGTEIWTGPQQDLFYLSPAAFADGRVFASTVYRPLIAFDAESGDVLWTSEGTCSQVRAAPAVVGSVVYLACFTGTLFALDAATGEVLWQAVGGCVSTTRPGRGRWTCVPDADQPQARRLRRRNRGR
jgi:outer membrane protein assembly factor BamB